MLTTREAGGGNVLFIFVSFLSLFVCISNKFALIMLISCLATIRNEFWIRWVFMRSRSTAHFMLLIMATPEW